MWVIKQTQHRWMNARLSHWKKRNLFISRDRILSQLIKITNRVFITTSTLLIWTTACFLQFADPFLQWKCQPKQLPPSSYHQQSGPVPFFLRAFRSSQPKQVSNWLSPQSPLKPRFFQLGQFTTAQAATEILRNYNNLPERQGWCPGVA